MKNLENTKMKSKILTTLLVILSLGLFAQVSINTDGADPDGSAMLDVKSTTKDIRFYK